MQISANFEIQVSVVIPTLGLKSVMEGAPNCHLLEGLSQQTLCQVGKIEVLIIGNFYDAYSARLVAAFAAERLPVRYCYTGKLGVNRARNLGLREAHGEIVIFLDDDCLLRDRDFCDRHYWLHHTYCEMIAVGGGYLRTGKTNCYEQAYHANMLEWLARSKIGGIETVNLLGGNVSYKRKLLLEGGWCFNDDIVFGGAETEFHGRLFRSGYRLGYFSGLDVYHKGRLGLVKFCQKAFYQGKTYGYREAFGMVNGIEELVGKKNCAAKRLRSEKSEVRKVRDVRETIVRWLYDRVFWCGRCYGIRFGLKFQWWRLIRVMVVRLNERWYWLRRGKTAQDLFYAYRFLRRKEK